MAGGKIAGGSVALDFDGTLAEWRRGVEPNYSDPEATMRDCYSNPMLLIVAQQLRLIGCQLYVVTGRDGRHQDVLQRWLRLYGIDARIHCRPGHIPLSCQAQASWKASLLTEIDPIMFIGDNPRIDEEGAKQASVPFVHVNQAAEFIELVRSQQNRLEIEQSMDAFS